MTRSPNPSQPSGLPKGVRAVRARRADGTTATYWYCRVTGARLPSPDEPGFAAALQAVRNAPPAGPAPGSLGHLLAAWRRSPEYQRISESTRDNRERYLRAISTPAWLARSAASITRAELLELRDAIAENNGPGAANCFHEAVAALLGWALDRGHIQQYPLVKVRRMEGGHLRAWTEEEAQVALAWRHRDRLRRAIVMAYYTGMRRGDIARLRWDQVRGGLLVFQPEKTAKRRERKQLGPLRLPIHPELRLELDAWSAENARSDQPSLHVLQRADGLPWNPDHLSQELYQAVRKESLPAGLNFHGFRKLAAARLAEAGATANEIAAAIGWESLTHVELYTRSADQQRLAEAAVRRLENRVSKAGKNSG